MFFLNGVHNSKQSRAPCTKGTKNLKIQKFRKQRKDTGILDKTTNEGTLAENDLKLALPYLTRLLNGESS